MSRASSRLAAYEASLPAGLDSYPSCAHKGSIVRMWMSAVAPLESRTNLPAPVRALVESPPLASSWVPEAHANALYLAMCDEHYPSDDDFVDLCFELNLRLLRSPLYRAMTLLSSPTAIVQAFKVGWPLFHRGTHLALARPSPTSMRLRLSFPPGVMPELIARCQGTGFRAALVAMQLTKNERVELTSFARDSAVYEATWEPRGRISLPPTR